VTVVRCDAGAVVGADVRGGAPATRETDLCRPGTLVESAHAIVLSGGSAFGLAAADGVTAFLRDEGIGFPAGAVRVPIVPAACIFDLGIGAASWPDAAMGRDACAAATSDPPTEGCVGAGLGATVGKALGIENATKSGLGTASVRCGRATVGALVVVNAFGDVGLPEGGVIVAGARDPGSGEFVDSERYLLDHGVRTPAIENTTIGVVATDASLSKEAANYLARVAHDGLARVIRPVHTLADGDTLFALATGRLGGDSPPLLALGVAAVRVVEEAVIRAVTMAESLGSLPAARLPAAR
jgi:L-aminopeptidase/D-esterase-like protein